MPTDTPTQALQLFSLVKDDQTVEVYLEPIDVPEPGPSQVLIRVEATPINPSDLGGLLAGADPSDAVISGTRDRPVVSLPLTAPGHAGRGRADRPADTGRQRGSRHGGGRRQFGGSPARSSAGPSPSLPPACTASIGR